MHTTAKLAVMNIEASVRTRMPFMTCAICAPAPTMSFIATWEEISQSPAKNFSCSSPTHRDLDVNECCCNQRQNERGISRRQVWDPRQAAIMLQLF